MGKNQRMCIVLELAYIVTITGDVVLFLEEILHSAHNCQYLRLGYGEKQKLNLKISYSIITVSIEPS